jgi:PAS domain S-box-containing protein/diguanylate cyclase (GGDEF)-like protein
VNLNPETGPEPRWTDDGALDAEALLDALLAQSGVGVTIVDRDLRFVRANEAFGVFGERTPAEVIGRTIADALPQLAAQIVPAALAVLKSGVPAVAHELVARDLEDPAKTKYFRTFRCPVVAKDGSIVGVASTVIDITDLKNVQSARDDAVMRQRGSDVAELASRRAEAEAEGRYRTIFEGASIGIIRVDRTGRVVEVNPALEQMLGYSAVEFASMKFQEYTHPDDVEENLRHFADIMDGPRHAYQFEKRCFRKDGEMIWVRVTSVAERDAAGERNYAITMLEDITERKLAEQTHREHAELNEYQATHDALTGLGNRRKLYSDIECALLEAGEQAFALGLFDLDGFKAYNDAFGHPAGDALLARLGRRIADASGESSNAYRMGGDEFCVITRATDAERILENARLALCDQGDGFSIRCSFGVVLVPSEATELERALQLADERLYADKRTHRVSESRQVRDALVQLIAEQRHELAPNTVHVADLAAATATRLGLSREEVAATRIAAELHDIGKTALPEAILNKPGPLNSEEWAFVRRHTVIGERILAAAPALARIAPMVRASHERPDGEGYPDGLTADAIPIGARIIAVVDAFDAMVSPRPYRPAMSAAEGVAELHRCAGTQFDAIVVAAFVYVIENLRLELRAA